MVMIITSVATLDAAGGIRRNCKAICRCLLHLHGTLRGLLPGGGHSYDSLATNFPLFVDSEAGPLMRMATFQIGQIVRTTLIHFRGVIFAVTPTFSTTNVWGDAIPKPIPP